MSTPSGVIVSGRRFGSLTVIREDSRDAKSNRYYRCICECRKFVTVRADALRSGRTTSCGCRKAERLRRERRLGSLAGSAFGPGETPEQLNVGEAVEHQPPLHQTVTDTAPESPQKSHPLVEGHSLSNSSTLCAHQHSPITDPYRGTSASCPECRHIRSDLDAMNEAVLQRRRRRDERLSQTSTASDRDWERRVRKASKGLELESGEEADDKPTREVYRRQSIVFHDTFFRIPSSANKIGATQAGGLSGRKYKILWKSKPAPGQDPNIDGPGNDTDSEHFDSD